MSAISSIDPIVILTPNAAEQVKQMLTQVENAGKTLRIYVEAGGCSGLQYGMVFDEQRDGDHLAEFYGVPLIVDKESAEFLRGTVVDFSDALSGGGFKISNPKARSSCGCGKSFEA
ncbi:MAG: HesB/IscA family protein [Verrucomicrobiales bacterium]